MCPEYYRYYDGDMSQDGCDQSEQASVSARLGLLVMGGNTTEIIDYGKHTICSKMILNKIQGSPKN